MKHGFCQSCAKEWFQDRQKINCMICRSEIEGTSDMMLANQEKYI